MDSGRSQMEAFLILVGGEGKGWQLWMIFQIRAILCAVMDHGDIWVDGWMDRTMTHRHLLYVCETCSLYCTSPTGVDCSCWNIHWEASWAD